MDDQQLDDEIERLEASAAMLRAERRKRGQLSNPKEWEAPGEGGKEGDPFMVHTCSEMTSDRLPDLARLVLDAIPVQIFFKRAHVEDRGRKYIYLNRTARKILNWSEEEVPGKYDGDAFPNDEESSKLFKKMQLQEGEAIKIGRSRLNVVDWTPRPGEWHHNSVIEIPILTPVRSADGTEDLSVTCYVSIAQDLVFRERHKFWTYFQLAFHHHLKNLRMSVFFYIMEARYAARRARQNQNQTPQELDKLEAALGSMASLLSVSELSSEILYSALQTLEELPRSTGRVDKVLSDVGLVYRDSPFDIKSAPPGEVGNLFVPHPTVLTAILLLLVGNAVKYSDPSRPLENAL